MASRSAKQNPPTQSALGQSATPGQVEPSTPDHFGHTNWLLLGLGLVLLVVGYLVLSMADERASNLAGRLSPFLILGAYGLIFTGLIIRSGK